MKRLVAFSKKHLKLIPVLQHRLPREFMNDFMDIS